jgi:hypothetical protein
MNVISVKHMKVIAFFLLFLIEFNVGHILFHTNQVCSVLSVFAYTQASISSYLIFFPIELTLF